MRTFLDLDEVMCDFLYGLERKYPQYKKSEQVNYPLPDYVDMNKLYQDMGFWLALPILDKPTIEIAGIVSHRPFPTYITEFWLHINKLPRVPVYHVNNSQEKAQLLLDLKADVYVDDKWETVLHCASLGINAFCYNQPWNQTHEYDKRISKLVELERLL